ncbi:hypothetical protein G6F56_000244 [Rhizopus delemar]|nr:hypothetical protein G6F56_000244 [Rhizopus delemar]
MAEILKILAPGNLSWCFKCLLEDSVRVVKTMKEEHEEYSFQKILSSATESRTPLSTLLKLDIQKSVKGSGYNLLLPDEYDEEQASVRFTQSK